MESQWLGHWHWDIFPHPPPIIRWMEQEGVSAAAYGRGGGVREWHAVAVGAQITCSSCLFALVPFRHPAAVNGSLKSRSQKSLKSVVSKQHLCHFYGIFVLFVPICKPVWDEWIVGLFGCVYTAWFKWHTSKFFLSSGTVLAGKKACKLGYCQIGFIMASFRCGNKSNSVVCQCVCRIFLGIASPTPVEMQIAAADGSRLYEELTSLSSASKCELFHSVLIFSVPTECMTNILQLDASFNFSEHYNQPALSHSRYTWSVCS